MQSTTLRHEPIRHELPANLTDKVFLFDGDDTAYETECAAFRGCTKVVNDLLRQKGRQFQFDPLELMNQFRGSNAREIMTKVAERFDFTLTSEELDTLVRAELEAAITQLAADAEAAPEIVPVLQTLQAARRPSALVSSSAKRRIDVCLDRTGLRRFFDDDVVFSAVDSLNPAASKPDPAIYLFACKSLGVSPDDCIAFEDSVSGIKAAAAAGIRVVGYVGLAPLEEREKRASSLLEAGAWFVIESWDVFFPTVESLNP
jgi:HAD superfamily hydrolase (TIGR01509 family)